MPTRKEQDASPRIRDLQQKIQKLEEDYEKLRASIAYEVLHGYKPNPRVENLYGWVYTWLRPLYTYLDKATTPDIRNQVILITRGIILQLTISGKYGVRIPHEIPEQSFVDNFQKQLKYYELNYDPCDICGEKRITHQCHIIPRVDGGLNSPENMVTLCPLHHHLFDHYRLSPEEWRILLTVIGSKQLESVIIFTKTVRQKQQEHYWNHPTKVSPIRK